ncbi:MAG: type II secretion system GspH family protein, partial [Gemmatimonadetes bacterium]|nr:type II secretion system GspH family protein [Gemmatimonadota bacterium]
MWSCSDARRGRPGFVLLEAVVALAIIGLVAVALLSTTGTQLRTTSKANALLTARSLAEDRLAALRFLGYDELQDVPDSLRAGRFPPPFDDFEWTARVDEMEDEYDLFGAEVIVTGRGESFPLRTLGSPGFDTKKWLMHVAPVREPGWTPVPWVRFAAPETEFLGPGPTWML